VALTVVATPLLDFDHVRQVFEDDYAADDDEYEPTKVEAVDIDGKHVYDWGVLDWTWEWE